MPGDACHCLWALDISENLSRELLTQRLCARERKPTQADANGRCSQQMAGHQTRAIDEQQRRKQYHAQPSATARCCEANEVREGIARGNRGIKIKQGKMQGAALR
jgi:hypothetical protein